MKRKVLQILSLVAIIVLTSLMAGSLTGCFSVYTVPSGHIGKILTPSGFEKDVIPSSQVNLGTTGCNQQQSRLVILESTTITILEKFRDAASSDDANDHRIMTADGVPTVVDMYVRVALPDDTSIVNNIFLTVTPEETKQSLVSLITLKNIYTRFVEMDTRNRVRAIISTYPNFQSIIDNYKKVNKEVAEAIIQAFKDNNVPLKLQDAQLSQVLPDPQVWDSEVKKKSAEALQGQIAAIGETIAANPSYLEYLKWQALQNIAAAGSASGVNTIIITDGNGQQSADANSWAAMQTLLNELKALGVVDGNTKLTVPTPTPTEKK